jgi:hypothetical protein
MPVINDEKDAVIGCRRKGSDIRYERVAGKFILKHVTNMVAGEKIPDLNSGMRCFKAEVIKKYLHLLPQRFSASTTTTLIMIKRGYRLGYQDITTQKRVGVSSVKIIKDGFSALKLILRIVVLFEAFNFFFILSMTQIVLSCIYGTYIAITYASGVPVLASTVFLSGVITLFMGIIADQIVEMRKERLEED